MEGAETPFQWTRGTIRINRRDEYDNLAGGLKYIWLLDTALTFQISKIVGEVKVWKRIRDHQLTYIRALHMARIYFP